MKSNFNIRKTELKDAEQYVRLNTYVWRCAYKDIFPESVFVEGEKNININKSKRFICLSFNYVSHSLQDKYNFVYKFDNDFLKTDC